MAKRPAKTETDRATPSKQPEAPPQRDYKGVMARINRAGWKELGQLSIDRDAPFQQLFVEALNDLLQKHGRPPLVESRVLPKDE